MAARKGVPALGRTTDVGATIAIHVAKTSVMRGAMSIASRKHVANPALGRVGVLGHLQPSQRIGDGGFLCCATGVGDEVNLTILIYISCNEAVRAKDFIIDRAVFPRAA